MDLTNPFGVHDGDVDVTDVVLVASKVAGACADSDVVKEGRASFSHMNVVYFEATCVYATYGCDTEFDTDSWLLGRLRCSEGGIVVGGFLCTIVTIRDIVLTLT